MHTPNYDFTKDIELGHEAEEAVLAQVKTIFPQAYRVDGYEPRWDIVIPELQKTIEVKNDIMAGQTGNLAIECQKKTGAPSGIMVSEADFWVIIADDEMLLMGREALKNYVTVGNFRKVWGGDRNSAEMYLVPLAKIRQQDFLFKIG